MATTDARLDPRADGTAHVGTSGFSYPSWRGGFYPAGARQEDFLRLYAERLPSVELNVTGYRLPSEESFARWRAAVPGGFTFAVKLPARALRALGTFEERAAILGEALGVIRVVLEQPRDDGTLALLLGSLDPGVRVALDLRHPSWDEVDLAGTVRVGDWDADAPFRYVRFRDPPYGDEELEAAAARMRPLLAAGVDVFAYFRHEDEPTAPAYAERLLALLAP
ncbi:MAG TPA: DUF72 domain-containing protein [Gaiellaceae bacterium]|nr:DUF72 domain-containing protein [Gaiellaceae bacterium]